MKPILFTLGLTTSLLCAPGFARAQTKAPQPELLAAAPTWIGHHAPWGTVPPPRPLPYGYFWSEYRGAEIEHSLYAPRHHGHVVRSAGPTCLVSQFCCWFDKLFARKCTATGCVSYDGHVPTDLPPLPTLAPLPLPPGPPPENTVVDPLPMPIPAPPSVALPAPQDSYSPAQADPTDPAPLMPPVDLIPSRPLVEQQPAKLQPVESIPLAPSVDEPRPLASERPPVVELAPEFVVPEEPVSSTPHNDIPPGVLVPRNLVPQKTVPLNTVPGRR
jgi:hypothetical protein